MRTMAPRIDACKSSNCLPTGPLDIGFQATKEGATDIIMSNSFNDVVQLLTVVTDDGQAAIYVLADDIQPRWKNHSFSDKIELLSYDQIDLQFPESVDYEQGNVFYPYLVPHPIDRESIFCIHSAGAHEIRTPYLRILEQKMSINTNKELPSTSVLTLFDSVAFSAQYVSNL